MRKSVSGRHDPRGMRQWHSMESASGLSNGGFRDGIRWLWFGFCILMGHYHTQRSGNGQLYTLILLAVCLYKPFFRIKNKGLLLAGVSAGDSSKTISCLMLNVDIGNECGIPKG